MKKFSLVIILLAAAAAIVSFDPIIIFLLSGIVPGLNITIPPSTMLAIMIASVALVFALKNRHRVYNRCLSLYDEMVAQHEQQPTTQRAEKSYTKLPRRRYQEL